MIWQIVKFHLTHLKREKVVTKDKLSDSMSILQVLTKQSSQKYHELNEARFKTSFIKSILTRFFNSVMSTLVISLKQM